MPLGNGGAGMKTHLPRLDRMHWYVRPNCVISAETLPQLHHAAATIVKANRFRTIYRVQIGGLDMHVKHCRPVGIRAWLREWVRPAKAVLEYQNLVRLHECGIPTLEPVAAGAARSHGPAESVLLTASVPDATTLTDFLTQRFPLLARAEQTRCRQRLAVSLGQFLGQLFCAGVRHDDLHPGNLLVSWKEMAPAFRLLDVHDIGINSKAPDGMNALVLFNRWFALRATRTDRLRCWRALERHLHDSGRDVQHDPRRLEQATLQSNIHLWHSRFARSCADNRHFQRICVGNARGFAVRDVALDVLTTLMADPDAAIANSVQVLKHSRSSTVAIIRVRLNGMERHAVLKRFPVRKRWHGLRSLLRTTACLRSWQNGHGLGNALLPTPRPLAVWQYYRYGLPRDGYLLQEFVDGSDLHTCCQQLNALPPKLASQRQRALIVALARFVRLLHGRGWSHRDLKASNLLVTWSDSTPQLTLVDLVGATHSKQVTLARRLRDIARLNASFINVGSITRTDHLRFLRTYLNWGLHGTGNWKTAWRQVAQFTQKKQVRNVRRNRLLA